jgi:CheY-like chemotaxis protein
MDLQKAHRGAARTDLAELRTEKALIPWRRGRTLLLVEDDTEMRRMLAAALRRDGHVVVEAANGDDALDWLGPGVLDGDFERVPDLVVSDVRLPYFTGLEILESLQIAAQRIPVILITGFPGSRDLRAGGAARSPLRAREAVRPRRAAARGPPRADGARHRTPRVP